MTSIVHPYVSGSATFVTKQGDTLTIWNPDIDWIEHTYDNENIRVYLQVGKETTAYTLPMNEHNANAAALWAKLKIDWL